MGRISRDEWDEAVREAQGNAPRHRRPGSPGGELYGLMLQFAQNEPKVLSYRKTLSNGDIEDALQDKCTELMQRVRDGVDAPANPTAWVRTAVTRKLADVYRSQKRKGAVSDDGPKRPEHESYATTTALGYRGVLASSGDVLRVPRSVKTSLEEGAQFAAVALRIVAQDRDHRLCKLPQELEERIPGDTRYPTRPSFALRRGIERWTAMGRWLHRDIELGTARKRWSAELPRRVPTPDKLVRSWQAKYYEVEGASQYTSDGEIPPGPSQSKADNLYQKHLSRFRNEFARARYSGETVADHAGGAPTGSGDAIPHAWSAAGHCTLEPRHGSPRR